MDLPSHLSFGLAIGLIFFGNSPEIVLLIGLGTLIPDLDREYWYVKQKIYADEQYHRARFHNVFLILLGYLVNPFFSLGIFLHMLQDSFTTAKDRGVEWFYPLTRLVKRGMYDTSMNPTKPDPSSKIYFYQEDVLGYANAADPDLREGDQPVPWRRVYGFAQNSHLLDRGFLFGSLATIVIWLIYPFWFVHAKAFSEFLESAEQLWIVGYAAVAALFIAGETQRRDKLPKLPQLKPIQVPLFALGIALLLIWGILFWPQVLSNIENIFADPFPVIAGAITIPTVAFALVKYYTRGGRQAIV
ncbi:MAG TPA: metal-dependent hydrolase [Candidatus Bathyarchaeia archaeon]|nr:metal-dependent hydrolase [Candidatus Bathyarchaeia archaeon]